MKISSFFCLVSSCWSVFLVAVPAVYRSVSRGFKRHFCFSSAVAARYFVHFSVAVSSIRHLFSYLSYLISPERVFRKICCISGLGPRKQNIFLIKLSQCMIGIRSLYIRIVFFALIISPRFLRCLLSPVLFLRCRLLCCLLCM